MIAGLDERARHALAGAAQDAYHYFLAAGGQKLWDRYGESAFSRHNMNSLRERLKNLNSGYEKLFELVDMIEEKLPGWHRGKGVNIPGGYEYPDVETIADVEKYARRGLKMTAALCDRFGCDAQSGRLAMPRSASGRGGSGSRRYGRGENKCENCGRAIGASAQWCDSNCFNQAFNKKHYGG